MVVEVLQAVYIANLAAFSAFLGWIGYSAIRRQFIQQYVPRGFTVCLDSAENLGNAAWTWQSVVAQVQVFDCGVENLGGARIHATSGGSSNPRWTDGVVLSLPGLNLCRLVVKVRLFARNTLSPDTPIGSATLGYLISIADGVQRSVQVDPRGSLTFTVYGEELFSTTQRSQDKAHTPSNLPVAIAEPMMTKAPP